VVSICDQVKRTAELLRERRPDLAVEGPIQYDAAVDPEVAAVKVKGGSEVAGRANVCIFPDLNTGNNTYKVRHVGRALSSLKAHNDTNVHPIADVACMGLTIVRIDQ